ncbi:MAG: FAD binding domain-containing protein [Acidimicrobiia bacterium]|nr:FAD binding domain-containing protein [Acidimicrobiia bacterium]
MTYLHELHHVQRAPLRVPRYVSPVSLSEALELMALYGERAKPVAGGTDLMVELVRRAHAGLEALIDLSRLMELATIEVVGNGDNGAVRLGAMVTHNQVVASAECRRLILPLAQACLEVGSPQLRNRATVAGNVVTASPANDTISALMALGATIEIASVSGTRSVPITDFFTGIRSTVLAPAELVTAVVVPALGPNQRGVFVKAGLRRAQAISVVHLAATVTFDTPVNGALDEADATGGAVAAAAITGATLALGSVAPTVVPVRGLSEALAGRPLDADSIATAVALAADTATPIDDLRATADYRAAVLATMVERALGAIAAGRHHTQWPDSVPLLAPSGPSSQALAATVDIGSADPITATVNGVDVAAAKATGITLLDWLRDQVGLTGVKEGCAEGECGACTVLLDGQAIMSCLTPAARAHGAEVVTVEGLADDGRLTPIQDAFVRAGGVQCGFCTPGFLVSCAALLDENPEPTIDQIKLALTGNLCRCTGYKAIESAVRLAAGADHSEVSA